jgi:fimbrial chaperone protein
VPRTPAPLQRALRAVLLTLAAAALPGAHGAMFGVSPIRIDLTPDTRSAVINVTNDDTRRLYFQAKLVEWTQTPEGQDHYAESKDLIFFPAIFTIEPGDKRIIRVGSKGAIAPSHRAYRLFIEELPDPNEKAASGGAQVAVRMRFGVPIIVGRGEARPSVVEATAAAGAVKARIRNDGDRMVRFDEVTLVAGERQVGKVAGWYVFPGATREFVVPVESSACPISGTLELRASVDGKVTRGNVAADPALCPR